MYLELHRPLSVHILGIDVYNRKKNNRTVHEVDGLNKVYYKHIIEDN